jgi:hypothetical protein
MGDAMNSPAGGADGIRLRPGGDSEEIKIKSTIMPRYPIRVIRVIRG